jgi:hypothetical protein
VSVSVSVSVSVRHKTKSINTSFAQQEERRPAPLRFICNRKVHKDWHSTTGGEETASAPFHIHIKNRIERKEQSSSAQTSRAQQEVKRPAPLSTST